MQAVLCLLLLLCSWWASGNSELRYFLDSRFPGNDTLGLARPGSERLLHSAKLLRFSQIGNIFAE